jgi:sugar phosphate isomerase/epimerase
MKIGYSTWGMPTLSIDTALEHLAALGFDGVELTVIPGFSTELDTLDSAERERIRQLLDRHGLDLPAVAAHQPMLSTEDDVHAENWRRLTASAGLCVDLAGTDGVPVLNTTLGSNPNEWNSQQNLILERVGALVDYCTSREVVLAIEPHVGDGLNSPERSLWLLEEINSAYLKLNFDISHFEVQGMSTAQVVQLLAPHSAHTHVKDQRGLVPDYEFLIPGEGPFDFVEYLKLMQKAGYDGYITAEVSMQVQGRPDYDPLGAAELTYATLGSAFRQAEINRQPF